MAYTATKPTPPPSAEELRARIRAGVPTSTTRTARRFRKSASTRRPPVRTGNFRIASRSCIPASGASSQAIALIG